AARACHEHPQYIFLIHIFLVVPCMIYYVVFAPKFLDLFLTERFAPFAEPHTVQGRPPMWRNGRRNGLKIRWALNGPCRFESGHRHSETAFHEGKLPIFNGDQFAHGGASNRTKTTAMCQV